MIFGLLPVKAPANAKQRLSALLTAGQRERLARLMYEHALEQLCSARRLDRVVVVTSDAEAASQARRAGALVFEEQEQLGHSHSAEELAFSTFGPQAGPEGGHRLHDLLRFNMTWKTGLDINGRPYGTTTCWPLPTVELQGNPNIKR